MSKLLSSDCDILEPYKKTIFISGMLFVEADAISSKPVNAKSSTGSSLLSVMIKYM